MKHLHETATNALPTDAKEYLSHPAARAGDDLRAMQDVLTSRSKSKKIPKKRFWTHDEVFCYY